MIGPRTLTEALGGRWHGSYGLAFCPAHANTRTPALSLKAGDDGRLLAHCHAGCTFAVILDALRGRGLMPGGGAFSPPDPAALARHLAEDRAKAAKRAAQAQRLWDDAQPVAGTLAETYLRARGITCALPETLRFAPSCWHATAQRFPALVALVQGAEAVAVHRTYLRADGAGKAAAAPPKAMLGACGGGAVRLTHGAGPLFVAEGIETALSIAGGSGMTGLHMPTEAGALTIAPDGDPAGRKAAHALAERATALGWAVALLPAPDGMDWNDVLTMKRGAA
jgi:hypothetical protein